MRVGQAVNLAVDRFVTVGEKIGEENPEINHDMCEACRDAKVAGKIQVEDLYTGLFYEKKKEKKN